MKKGIWRRALATLLAVCLVTALAPSTLLGAWAAETHTHPDDAGAAWIPLSLEKDSEGGKDVLKAGESSITDNRLPAGNYYLAEDMTLSSATTEGGMALHFAAGTSALCLNGHTLNGRVYADGECDLTVSDCGEGGAIAHTGSAAAYIQKGGVFRLVSGTLSSTGGSTYDQNVYVSADGTFEMGGGAVTATNQVAVSGSGTMEISGGTISSGYRAVQASGSLTLSGSPALIGGEGDDTAASIWLSSGKLITLKDFTGAPEPYTVYTPSTEACQFATGAVSGDVDSFVSKTTGFIVEYREEGQLWFAKHVHQWEEGWTYDETEHWHACAGAGVCDEVKHEAAAHAAEADTWLDDTRTGQHYKKCSVCGAAFSCGDHTWTAGEAANGTRVDTCSVCGATRTVDLRGISGTVTTQAGEAVSGASVALMQGRTTVATTTSGAAGAYTFSDVAPGVYNVVAATAEGKIVTVLVTVSDADALEQDLTIPASDVSSKVVLSVGYGGSATASSIPGVVVGGLQEEAVAQAESDPTPFTLCLTDWYYGHAAPGTLLGITELGEAVGAEFTSATINEVEYQIHDFKVEKVDNSGGVTEIPVTNNVLTIVIPYSMGGRTNVAVHRCHDGAVRAFTKLWSEPAEPMDGTFWADLEHNLIYLYTNKFSACSITSTNGNNVPEKTGKIAVEADLVHGAVTAGAEEARAGETVTLTVTPDVGYEAEQVTITYGEITETVEAGADGAYTFKMPAEDVTVSATFRAAKYTVTVEVAGNGQASVAGDPTYFLMGDTVALTVEPEEGYELDKIEYTYTVGADTKTVEVAEADGAYTFTMPAANVTVTVTFTAVEYAVTVEKTENGQVTADRTYAAEGGTVTLTVTPAGGYELDALTVIDQDGNPVPVAADNTFTMPASDVTVSATFKEKPVTPTVDTKDLEDALQAAKEVYALADDTNIVADGTQPSSVNKGETVYPQSAVDALRAAIAQAEDALANATTQADVDAAVEALGQAVADFEAAAIVGTKVAYSGSSGHRPGDRGSAASTTTKTNPLGDKVTAETTANGDKTVTVTGENGEVIAAVELPAQAPDLGYRFEDVPAGCWAESAIQTMAAMKVFQGVSATRHIFDMGSAVTRGTMAQVLFNLSQGKAGVDNPFADAQDSWYSDAVAWAASAGVVTGVSDTSFAPDDSITREQLVTMLYRYAQLLALDTGAAADLGAFVDADDVDAWASQAMTWAVGNGLLLGKGAGTLDPTAAASRAEAAVIIDRFLQMV